MEDKQQKPISKIEQIRKDFPKAGMRWSEEESNLLNTEYKKCLEEGYDFESFLDSMAVRFGRRPNGIRGRLALSFPNIPGWDYEAVKQRDEEYRKQKLEIAGRAANPQTDKILVEEYEKYLSAKNETFRKLTLRLSKKIGLPRSVIRPRLLQLIGNVVEYTQEDVGEHYESVKHNSEADIEEIDISANPEMLVSYKLMEDTRENIFLTGEAGTGKSTLLKYFKNHTNKNTVVLAPTGVAAVNVGGQTIHSFCGFGPDITIHRVKKLSAAGGKKELLQRLSTVIIDEISMVRADLLDCVDRFLRLNGPAGNLPFGGVQMIFIGDLFQLPPIDKDFTNGGLFAEYKSPYFFDARSFAAGNFKLTELKTVYRQKDRAFLEILNAVRNNVASTEHLEVLNTRSEQGSDKFAFEQFAVYLTPTNARAAQVNDYYLNQLSGQIKVFEGFASGKLEGKTTPGESVLKLKVGAQVMMLNNDSKKRWVNGTMGKVLGFVKSGDVIDDALEYLEEDGSENGFKFPEGNDLLIRVELETGETVYVGRHTWEMFNFYLDKHTQKVESKTVGEFTQYPLKLAWALTIHKSQGKTFDKVYVDLAGGTFAHGQLYVALSRCRTLEGLYLKRPVAQSDILLDKRIVEFLSYKN